MKLDQLTEALPSVTKMVNRAIKNFKKEHPAPFKSEISLSTQVINSTTVVLRLDFNKFLCDSKEDKREFELMERDLVDLGDSTDATKVEVHDSFFAGYIAASLIKRGKQSNGDALMSWIEVKLSFPVNFKR